MQINSPVAGKVVLITGAARGQGEALARRLTAQGARVALTDVLDDQGRRVAAELGDLAFYQHLDVRSEQDWTDAVTGVREHWGRLDALVNNAGILVQGSVLDLSMKDFDEVTEVNQRGIMLGMRAAVPALREAGGGAIVNIASIDGLIGVKHSSAYCASKFAVVGMTRAAAAELGPEGIRVNAVCPGIIDSPMTSFLPDPVKAWLAGQLPMRRFGSGSEVAGLVTFLLGDDSSYCTGGSYVVDGGWTSTQLTF